MAKRNQRRAPERNGGAVRRTWIKTLIVRLVLEHRNRRLQEDLVQTEKEIRAMADFTGRLMDRIVHIKDQLRHTRADLRAMGIDTEKLPEEHESWWKRNVIRDDPEDSA